MAYSGDTEWTEVLIELSLGADLFICEAYTVEKPVRYHLNYAALAQHRAQLACRQLVLTHMSADVLDRQAELDATLAADGLSLTL